MQLIKGLYLQAFFYLFLATKTAHHYADMDVVPSLRYEPLYYVVLFQVISEDCGLHHYSHWPIWMQRCSKILLKQALGSTYHSFASLEDKSERKVVK